MRHSNQIKLNLSLYFSLGVAAFAGYGLWWFMSHSFLSIKPMPREAVVTVDNAPVWISPLGTGKVTLSPGSHTIRVEADGYVGYANTVNLKRAQNKEVSVDLKEIPTPFSIGNDVNFLTGDRNDFNMIYYLYTKEQTLYRAKLGLDSEGNVDIKNRMRLTDPRVTGVKEIIWSPDKQLALFRKNDGMYMFDFQKYDFIHQTETKWGSDIGSAAWAPDNSKIAYYYAPKDGERSLVFANIGNTEMTRVANLAEMDIVNPILRWSPDSEWLLVIPRNAPEYGKNKIYVFNAYSRTFKQLTETGNQLDAAFSPDSNKILYSTYSQSAQNPITSTISVMDKDGQNQQSLNLRAELSKIAWLKDSKGIIVANYNEEKKQESLFSFNTGTKEKGGFSLNALNGHIDNLVVSDDGKMVIYEMGSGIYALKTD